MSVLRTVGPGAGYEMLFCVFCTLIKERKMLDLSALRGGNDVDVVLLN
jgi:hypothetical protein